MVPILSIFIHVEVCAVGPQLQINVDFFMDSIDHLLRCFTSPSFSTNAAVRTLFDSHSLVISKIFILV